MVAAESKNKVVVTALVIGFAPEIVWEDIIGGIEYGVVSVC